MLARIGFKHWGWHKAAVYTRRGRAMIKSCLFRVLACKEPKGILICIAYTVRRTPCFALTSFAYPHARSRLEMRLIFCLISDIAHRRKIIASTLLVPIKFEIYGGILAGSGLDRIGRILADCRRWTPDNVSLAKRVGIFWPATRALRRVRTSRKAAISEDICQVNARELGFRGKVFFAMVAGPARLN